MLAGIFDCLLKKNNCFHSCNDNNNNKNKKKDYHYLHLINAFADVDCGPLPGLEHGYVNLKDKRTTHGASAEFTCHENYTLIGREKRTCQDDGHWSDDQPQCLCKQQRPLEATCKLCEAPALTPKRRLNLLYLWFPMIFTINSNCFPKKH